MKITAVIAEYNPFHSGHAYHIRTARELSGADYVIVLMSPDFVQRGEPAFTDKYFRTEAALMGGADLVLELPVCFATGSAEYFAAGGVSLLSSLGCADYLSFGCEMPDPDLFQKAVSVTLSEEDSYREVLRQALKQGHTFPAARESAIRKSLPEVAFPPGFLSEPNNILAIEYMRALEKEKSPIRPLPIRRLGADYHQTDNVADFENAYPSAALLRRAFEQNMPEKRLPSGPAADDLKKLEVLRLSGRWYDPRKYDALLFASLLKLVSGAEDAAGDSLSRIQDMSPFLADRIRRYLFEYESAASFSFLLKTRNITLSQIRRALLHVFLSMYRQDADRFREHTDQHYVRILGFRKEASALLHALKKNSSVPLIAKPSSARRLLGPGGLSSFNKDVFASHLYPLLLHTTTEKRVNEFTRSPIIL